MIGEIVYGALCVVFVLFHGVLYVLSQVRWWSQLRLLPRVVLAVLILFLGGLFAWQMSMCLLVLAAL